MSILSNALRLLDEVGISQADIDKAIAESAEVKQAVVEKANEAKDFWRSIAPVNKYGDEEAGKPHVYNGHTDDPGDYRDSIRIKYEKGGREAKVYTNDYKSAGIEYGSVHNKEFACAHAAVLARTCPEGSSARMDCFAGTLSTGNDIPSLKRRDSPSTASAVRVEPVYRLGTPTVGHLNVYRRGLQVGVPLHHCGRGQSTLSARCVLEYRFGGHLLIR
jgi:hypothetical protein